jgi:hypothetical protein
VGLAAVEAARLIHHNIPQTRGFRQAQTFMCPEAGVFVCKATMPPPYYANYPFPYTKIKDFPY